MSDSNSNRTRFEEIREDTGPLPQTITLASGETVNVRFIQCYTGKTLLEVFEATPQSLPAKLSQSANDSHMTPIRWVVCSEYLPAENRSIEHVVATFSGGKRQS